MTKASGIPGEAFSIVDTPSGVGKGSYDACGRCGARLFTHTLEQAARDKMAEQLEERVLGPLGLLAGMLANVGEDAEAVSPAAIGFLLGLTVLGARQELKLRRVGYYDVYTLTKWIEPDDDILGTGGTI